MKTYRYGFSDTQDNLVNYYRYIKCIPEDEIDKLRENLDTKDLHDATVSVDNNLDEERRRSKVFWLPKTDEFHEIYKLFIKLIEKCNFEFYRFKLTELVEDLQYTVYNSEDQGHYDWHIDMGPGNNRRKLSIVAHLSDPSEYEGGELQLNTGQIIVPEKEKGTVVMFPSYMVHRVTPVTKGTRRTLVGWVSGPSFT